MNSFGKSHLPLTAQQFEHSSFIETEHSSNNRAYRHYSQYGHLVRRISWESTNYGVECLACGHAHKWLATEGLIAFWGPIWSPRNSVEHSLRTVLPP
jgi:hypothetical protein